MNTISLTGYRRPELFKIQCDQLLKDKEEFDKYRLHLFLDYGFSPDYYKVISWLKQYHRNIKLTLRSEQESKKSPLPAFFNIIDSYRATMEESDEFVIVLEEDIIGTSDYLRFNRICYEQFLSKYDKLFCISHKRRPETELIGNPEILIGDFQLTSPSCISVKSIRDNILPHLTDLLYSNPIEYYKLYFNNCRIPHNEHIHQDGFLERCSIKNNLYSLKPDQARSLHVGVGGQHCGNNEYKIEGILDQKIIKYYDLISKGSKELRKYTDKFKEDIVVIPLDIEPAKKYIIDINRNLSQASSWYYDNTNSLRNYINKSNQ